MRVSHEIAAAEGSRNLSRELVDIEYIGALDNTPVEGPSSPAAEEAKADEAKRNRRPYV